MATRQTKSSDHNVMAFFYLALLFIVFFIYQLKTSFTSSIEQWDYIQYTLIFFFASFIIICFLKYRTIANEVILEHEELDLHEKTISLNKTTLYRQVSELNPYDFSELVADLFRADGYKRIFNHPKATPLFHDIEMYHDEVKVLVSCKAMANQQLINQAHLDRLYLQMRNRDMDKGYFVTLSDFTPECYEFAKGKPITLVNGNQLLEKLLYLSDIEA